MEDNPEEQAVLGSKEHMHQYQRWLEDKAGFFIGFANVVLKLIGAPAIEWSPVQDIEQPDVVPVAKPAAAPVARATTSPLGHSYGLKTIQTITGSGDQSVNVSVPYGYWELWYTADPRLTGGQSYGAKSAIFPRMAIEITDANTGEVIETVEPPGGLDKTLWAKSGDPRPWSQKFYRGDRDFIFDITADHVISYIIEVRIPEE